MFTVGYKNYRAVAKLGDTRVYAGENIDVTVEADRWGFKAGSYE
ncbi:MAG: hypothetical protein NZ954_03530 [Thermofilaceae archaeon]|nr:hypothetical protein [Thermofilaceae archaeon]MCX8181126.1 hypothetical protein [Thermofilaceae archaeon]MDW8004868.1 hypothetical protein [Thermofilaceae archaeon]